MFNCSLSSKEKNREQEFRSLREKGMRFSGPKRIGWLGRNHPENGEASPVSMHRECHEWESHIFV
jgi:hypothetical protein